jgi:hypothetical protein
MGCIVTTKEHYTIEKLTIEYFLESVSLLIKHARYFLLDELHT